MIKQERFRPDRRGKNHYEDSEMEQVAQRGCSVSIFVALSCTGEPFLAQDRHGFTGANP